MTVLHLRGSEMNHCLQLEQCLLLMPRETFNLSEPTSKTELGTRIYDM